LFVLSTFSAYAQDCPEPPKIIMGPDIDVCDGGSVMLSVMLEGAVSTTEWIGGKGQFESRYVVPGEYTPTADEVGKTIEFTLVAKSFKKACPNDTAHVKVRVNPQPVVSAGGNLRSCDSAPVMTQPEITGAYSSVTWTSTGTGQFDDPHKEKTYYRPSLKDIGMGAVTLELLVDPQGACLEVKDAVALSIEQPPVVSLTDSVIQITSGLPVVVEGKSNASKSTCLWTTTGTGSFVSPDRFKTSYEPSSEDEKNPDLKLSLTVTSATKTCVVKKEIHVLR
jgi:hypothetical protein